MIKTNWYVITGAPCSGKTTLINHLAEQGYTIASEVARDYIEGLLSHNDTLETLKKNNRALQRSILALALKRERHLSPEQLIFFDRGTADSLGYFNFYKLDTQQMKHGCQRLRYKKIFFCQPLAVIQDKIRVEDSEMAKKIGMHIYQAYLNLGYELIELPAIPIEERVQLILAHIVLGAH